ncbi:MAG: helix-turn-helix domain-containing protein [Fimbriimonadaceae bacterium]|nr:helix-turn-helix domain-containing protein [Fimbriimonadaceae bacterium]
MRDLNDIRADVPELLTPREAAAMLRIGRTKIYALLDAKAIKAKRIGRSIRIPRSELLRFLDLES